MTMSSSISKFSTSDVQRRGGGIDASTWSSEGGAMAQLLERPIDRLEQVVGRRPPDLDVGVADHAEQVRADDLDAGEQLRRG